MGNSNRYFVQKSRNINVKLQPECLAEINQTGKTTENLDHLPVEIIMKIFEYLLFEDILNLRKVSSGFYNASKCVVFYDKIKFKISKLSKETSEQIEHMLKPIQSKITLAIQDLPMTKIKYLLPYFNNVVDMSISLTHLEEVCSHCNNLHRLTVKLNVSAKQNYKDAFLCIRKLHSLNELIIEGEEHRFRGSSSLNSSELRTVLDYRYKQKALASAVLIISALKYSQSLITKLELRSISLPFDRYYCNLDLRKVFIKANHIKSWSFTECNDIDSPIPLPKSATKLEIIRGSFSKFDIYQIKVNTLILNETNLDDSYYSSPDYPHVKTLVLRKMCLKPFIYNLISFPNLENLTVDSPNCDVTRGQRSPFIDTFKFLKRFKSSLKSLTLISVDPVDYRQLGFILDLLLVLTDLCFIDVNRIPSDFLDAYKSRLKLTVTRR